jgi:sarcosine oxidase, subunit alpha
VSTSKYLTEHPVLGPRTGKRITFFFEGQSYEALEGETIAFALWGAGVQVLGYDERQGHARGLSCGIGHCYNCRVTIDGVPDVRSCTTPVLDGMQVRSQKGPEKGGQPA